MESKQRWICYMFRFMYSHFYSVAHSISVLKFSPNFAKWVEYNWSYCNSYPFSRFWQSCSQCTPIDENQGELGQWVRQPSDESLLLPVHFPVRWQSLKPLTWWWKCRDVPSCWKSMSFRNSSYKIGIRYCSNMSR